MQDISTPYALQTAASGPRTSYVAPFSVLKGMIKLVSVKGQLKVDLTYDEFLAILRKLLEAAPVNEAWYCETYPDVAEAIASGAYRGAKHHFVVHGYLEGRQPFPMDVDEEWYLQSYPDVRDGIEDGRFESAQQHFLRHGYEEGRKPANV